MIKLYNTLSSTLEILSPIAEKKLKIYMCGITVYARCHIGHARVMCSMDAIIRYLKFQDYAVYFVRNITDIDDKILARAKQAQQDIFAFTNQVISDMHEDFAKLNLLMPDEEPKVSSYHTEIIDMITVLIEKRHAYVDQGNVYFSVNSFPKYGALRKQQMRYTKSKISDDKQQPADFALWKKAQEGEYAWSSPWGRGRPGWHIECSAISSSLLGKQFDLHAGGSDLIFPHHENEIAQSTCANSCHPARYWMHMGLVKVLGEKMSKSLENFVYIQDVLAVYHPDDLRMFCLNSHYRSHTCYSQEAMTNAKNNVTKLYRTLQLSLCPDDKIEENNQYISAFEQAMNHDFNTPAAFSVIFRLAKDIKAQTVCRQHVNILKLFLKILGFTCDLASYFGHMSPDKAAINHMVARRTEYKNRGEYQAADKIRDSLLAEGIVLEDRDGITSWRKR